MISLGLLSMRLDPEIELSPSSMVPSGAFTTDDHTEAEYVYYQSEDATTICGIWKCAPCLEEEPWPVEELMTVISGAVNVTYKSNGTTETYTAGDSFYLPKGEDVIWEITETLTKYFMRG